MPAAVASGVPPMAGALFQVMPLGPAGIGGWSDPPLFRSVGRRSFAESTALPIPLTAKRR
jgi:hypothetical protein